MTWTMALFSYINLWWISLLFVWPFCVEAREPGQEAQGAYAAAPKHIYWKKMLISTSLVGAVSTGVIAIIIHFVK